MEENTITTAQTISWLVIVFEPNVLKETEDFNKKLTSHLEILKNESGESFPIERIDGLKEAISSFLKIDGKIRNMANYERHFYQHFRLQEKKRKKAKNIFNTANKLLNA